MFLTDLANPIERIVSPFDFTYSRTMLLRIVFNNVHCQGQSSVCWKENLTDTDICDNLATQLSGRLLKDNLK